MVTFRFRILSMVTTALAIGLVLGIDSPPSLAANMGRASVGPQLDPAFAGDTISPLRFVLEDYYRAGEEVVVQVENTGLRTYIYNPYYQACEMTYRDGSGRTFKIPPGTHCDLVGQDLIEPGETVDLFTWNLDECVIDRWGCVVARSLPPGAYTILGEFYATDGNSAIAQKTIVIVGDANPSLLAVALGAFGALVAAGLAALAIAARRRQAPPRQPSSRD